MKFWQVVAAVIILKTAEFPYLWAVAGLPAAEIALATLFWIGFSAVIWTIARPLFSIMDAGDDS